MTWLAVAVGASVGAVCRLLLDRAVDRPPWGLLLVNLLGSLLAGVVVGLGLDRLEVALLATGFLGGFTTASTLAADLLQRYEDGERRTALLELLLSVGPGLGLAALGVALGRAAA